MGDINPFIDDAKYCFSIEVGQLTFRVEPANIGKLVQNIVDTAAPVVWRMAKIDVVAEVPSELPVIVVDVHRLEQVIQNLIHNAVRHTSPGGIVAVQITIESDAVLFQVKDTGEGITPDDLPHIWKRFYQTESSRTRLNGGAGLGLALVKEWIEEMGGTVSVESIVGEGSCFTLRLPRAGACNDEIDLRRDGVRGSGDGIHVHGL